MAAMERQSNVDEAIRAAIAQKRLIRFELNGRPRIAEPHDYGVIKGVHKLFFYQVGGESQSGPPIGWRWAVIAQVSGLKILDRRFAGPRPAPSGRHAQWDELIATVSPRS
jgi:hypothetical protein